MTEQEKPLPCPFCGIEARIQAATIRDADENTDVGEYRVACMGCGVAATTWALSAEFAVNQWNRRAGAAPSDWQEDEQTALAFDALLKRIDICGSNHGYERGRHGLVAELDALIDLAVAACSAPSLSREHLAQIIKPLLSPASDPRSADRLADAILARWPAASRVPSESPPAQ